MSSNSIASRRRNNRDYLTDNSYFLAHENEPQDDHRSFTLDQIRRELREGKESLRRRVWRNMHKIHRHF